MGQGTKTNQNLLLQEDQMRSEPGHRKQFKDISRRYIREKVKTDWNYFLYCEY